MAPEKAPPGAAIAREEFFCFRLGDMQLGVPSLAVREVVRVGPLTALPRVPNYLLGVCAVRGEVLPVLDLLRFLSKGETRLSPRSRLFVGMNGNSLAAVVMESVLGLRQVKVSDILPPPIGGESSSEHLLGIVNNPKGDTLALLNFQKLLLAARQRASTR
jgi:purine-binding chemotaxis protein CheW